MTFLREVKQPTIQACAITHHGIGTRLSTSLGHLQKCQSEVSNLHTTNPRN